MLEIKSSCHTFKTISSKLPTREIRLQGCTQHGTINLEHIDGKMVQDWFYMTGPVKIRQTAALETIKSDKRRWKKFKEN